MILKDDDSNVFKKAPTDENVEYKFARKELAYENLSDKFKCLSKDFTKQFSHIYSNRLKIMRPRLLKNAKNKWGKSILYYLIIIYRNFRKCSCMFVGRTCRR